MSDFFLDDSTLDQFDGICYAVDAGGTVRAIGPRNWHRFAAEAEADTLDPARVKDRPLLDFVTGETVRRQLSEVFESLSSGAAQDWIMPFRCDAPNCQRNMRLSIRAMRDDDTVAGFLFQSILLEETRRPPIDLFDFEAVRRHVAADGTLPLVTMCSYCQKVRDDDNTEGDWVEADAYYARGGTAQVQLSHGVCGDCLDVASIAFRRSQAD